MEPRTLFENAEDVTIVDVREDDEREQGYIQGSRHIPMDALKNQVDELPDEQPIVTVCRSGARSGDMAELLRGEGLEAENLEGGIEAWKSEGLPLSSAFDGRPDADGLGRRPEGQNTGPFGQPSDSRGDPPQQTGRSRSSKNV